MKTLITALVIFMIPGCQPAPLAANDGSSAPKTKAEADAEAWTAKQEEAKKPLDPATVVRIALFRDGRIEVDGAPTEPEQVGAKLKSAAASKKSVVYYREDAEFGLSAQQKGAMPAILGAVAENLLPIRFSLSPDFSDTVADKGNSLAP